jgi:hypothetical protein
MARFPTYERQVGLSGGSTASYAGDAISAPARAIQNLGAGIADVGLEFEEQAKKIQATQDDAWFSKARAQTTVDMASATTQAQQAAGEGVTNYVDTVRGSFDQYRNRTLEAAPSDRARQMYTQWADSYGAGVAVDAAKFQAQSALAKRTSDFADAMNAHAQAIYANPDDFDQVYKRAVDDLEGARQWMTPEQETAAREKIGHDLKLARAKTLVEFRPEQFSEEIGATPVTGPEAIDSVVGRIIKVEGTGKNPQSSAVGVGQFIDSTWLSTVRRHRPDVAAGMSDQEVLRLKGNKALAAEMTKALTQDNAKDLAAAGLPVTAGNLYLAHFAGIGGARQILSAPDGATIASVMGAKAVEANAFLAGKSVGWLKSWAARKMGGAVTADLSKNPYYSGLSIDEIASLSSKAQSNEAANATSAYASYKDAFSLSMAQGEILSPDQILNSQLDAGDKAAFLNKFNEGNKDALAANAILGGLADGSLNVDPYDNDTRKAVDKAGEIIKGRATPEQYASAGEEIVRQTGVVPKDIVNEIRKGLESRNAAEVAAAAQRASRISQIDPAALGRRDGGSTVQDAADDFSHYVNDLNLPPNEAAKRIMESRDPEKQRERKALEPAAREFIKSISDFSIGDAFDTYLGSEPAVGFTPAQQLGMQAEFLAIAEDQFYRSNGDPDVAKNRAVEQMKRLYGVTEFNGVKAVVKHPPERYWPLSSYQAGGEQPRLTYGGGQGPGPVLGGKAEPSLDYARKQLADDVMGMDPDADMSTVQLVTTPDTDAMIKRGEMPAYAILYRDKNGAYQTIPGKLWKPDFSAAMAVQQGVEQADQAERVRKARDQQDIERQKATERGTDGGRATSLDNFLDANPLAGR